MKFNIVKNESRNTITVVISPMEINFVDYLYDRYVKGDKEYFFASAVFKEAELKKDLYPFMKKLGEALNEVGKKSLPQGVKIDANDIFSMNLDVYRLIGKNTNKDGDFDGQFKLSLKNNSKADDKKFLFKNFKNPTPIAKEDGWKHFYAVEIELGVGYNEDSMEKYVYSVFHRAFSVGAKEGMYQANDDAWGGFDFTEEEETPKKNQETKEDPFFGSSNITIDDDDLPF